MDYILNGNNENYNIQCGELYLTMQGNITFHCTLCENKYQNFQEYAKHIAAEHTFLNIDDCEAFDCVSARFSEQDDFETVEEKDSIEIKYSISLEDIREDIETSTVTENPKKTYSRRVRLFQKNDVEYLCKYKCTECTFVCKKYKNLVGHMKRHSEHRPYKCSECPKAFYTRCELTTHFRSHSGERPYLCPECGHGFITAGKLGEHIKRHRNKRDKACPMCKMKFFNTQSLRRHLTTHSQDRHHKCNACPASFKRRTALINHMKLHDNKLEYQCELCSAKFNQKTGLHSHMKTKHFLVDNTTNITPDKEYFEFGFQKNMEKT